MFDDNLNKLQILKPEETCETTIIVPTASGSRVLVEINLFDIDIQNDQLTINEIMVDKEDFHKEFPPNTQVNIKFSSKTDKSKSGKGFVICFRRLNKQESNDKSACHGIFEFGKDPKLTFDEDIQLEQETQAPTEESTTVSTTATKSNRFNIFHLKISIFLLYIRSEHKEVNHSVFITYIQSVHLNR
ncbi:unnamed protein product [Mytilus coruscus]|uniref:Uncharacterized protein n=1 Tax=Mytilus coruscus TaxID=42192 RepID=A0A6J8CXD0_MYTCO|nr:unnamed protein product [Mytilus coruscus]